MAGGFRPTWRAQPKSTETYAGHDIYNIPSDGRTVRVTLLGYDMVAASNTPTEEQIHSILDRYRTAALPFSGSSLLAAHYSDVPLLSVAWGVGQIGLPLGDAAGSVQVMGMSLPLTFDATFIASISWAGKTRLRVEEITPTDVAAKTSADSIGNILNFARAAEDGAAPGMADADTKALLDSAADRAPQESSRPHGNNSNGLLRKLVNAPVNFQGASRSNPQPASSGGNKN